MSGRIVDRRDQVLITFRLLLSMASWTFSIKWGST
jgi:hypothetical protein